MRDRASFLPPGIKPAFHLPKRMLAWAALLVFSALAGAVLFSRSAVSDVDLNPEKIIRGTVIDEKSCGVSGATVRIQTSQRSTVTSSDGSFTIAVPDSNAQTFFKLTAWAKGYFIGGPVKASSGEKDVIISIHRHSAEDNPDYKWLPSQRSEGTGENQGCAECHFRGKTGSLPPLPVDEWLEDAHSQSAVNPRFLTLYSGTDVAGRRSPLTRYMHQRDYGTFPLAPDMNESYFGPGYRLDFPQHSGSCAACHMATTAVNAPYDTDPTEVNGVGLEGINCDFCHKIWDVRLDPVTGLPFPNMPGVLSFEFRRPFDGHQFFAGPLDDIAPGEDTFSELQKKSQICAPCHFGVFWDTVIYDSFGEWLRSPYSDADTGKTCQDCHMPNTGAEIFALPEKGGLKRSTGMIFSHKMPGARDQSLLENAVSMTLEATGSPYGIRVKATIKNDQTGHHVPTDSPLRHLILVVRAFGADGKELALKSGPILPEWCGTGDVEKGCYAELPGRVFIKLLKEAWTGVSPTAAYWNPVRIVMDTRIAAFASDVSEYLFEIPENGGPAHVEAVLIYRRAYKDLMKWKGWNEPDIIMESASCSLSGIS